MENYLITIIIPIYNAEKYLGKTIESVLSQTYNRWELILVDDGATDETPRICKNYEQKDKRIRYIKQKKSGVSVARNKGLENANGEFICFIDADDYIEENMLELYIKVYEEYKYDLIVSGYFSEVHINKKIRSDKVYIKNKGYKNIDELKEDFVLLWDKHLLYNIWNKLYKKEIIKKYNIKFPKENWGEDIQFNREYLLRINTIYNMENCLYHYIRGRSETITGKYTKGLYDIRLKEDKEFREYFEKFGIEKEKYNEFCARRHLERTLGCVENIFNSKCEMTINEKYKEIERIINDDTTRKYLKEIKPKSKKVKILLLPYRIKSVILTMIMGKLLCICKEKLPGLFNGLKNRR